MKITLNVPPLLNSVYRISGRRMFKDHVANAYGWDVMRVFKQANIKCDLQNDIDLSLTWYRARKAGDIDAILKVLLDALEGNLYANDKQVKRLTIEKLDDKKNPRIELTWQIYKNIEH